MAALSCGLDELIELREADQPHLSICTLMSVRPLVSAL